MNGLDRKNPPLKAVAAALGGLIAGRPTDEIAHVLATDFELDRDDAERCIELARRVQHGDTD
ncbi:MAG TPA: hypothetical protein VFZ83_01535 [Acidimicrobiia bacterium]|nr:hypothetical protein [Acidimicrobiia bacterium]